MRSSVCKDYMPAGPLMDITVTSGEIEEVHLPHSVCIDQTSTSSGQFAVLHVGPCCDVVEDVPKVTSSHIKFLQPTFLPRGVMIRKMAGIPFYYDVLIYKTNKEFLALDVYVMPCDSALRQEVEEKQKSSGSILILNPSPDKSMQMGEHVSLTTDQVDAIIQPSARELRYESIFFEVLIRNTDSDFTLRLQSGKDTLWTCTFHKGDYQKQSAELSFSMKNLTHNWKFCLLFPPASHQAALINTMSAKKPVLDELKEKKAISETYDVRGMKSGERGGFCF
ncbi:hypothetical protein CesoFtcFv8_026712 [Champsocephalus esox]|uniref:FIIND domain-containing protein n=1 Tax=Champsocephalus esox TaxID=159716 RepID=A0AAN8AZN1_9TELE|nr:hypothetical protein CesoFtcFv8_026712 [Champsocephalus esox]